MKTGRKILSLVLAVIMIICLAPMTNATKTTYQVGDIVEFGSYPQSKASDGTYQTEPIEWRILSISGNTALLLSDKILDYSTYHSSWINITWEESKIRTWLNNTFYNKAFDEDEKQYILLSDIENEDNPTYNIDAGNDTTDKIFLLSLQESINSSYGFLSRYDEHSSRVASATDYAVNNGVYVRGSNNVADWWLRTPGSDSSRACVATYRGYTHPGGAGVAFQGDGVRPAMRIDLDAIGTCTNHQYLFDSEETKIYCQYCEEEIFISSELEFKFGRDNIGFSHSDVASNEISNVAYRYMLPSLKMGVAPILGTISNGWNYILNKAKGNDNGTWGGSCYGIATMTSSFMTDLSTEKYGASTINELTISNASLAQPNLDTKLKDSINIMLLSQLSAEQVWIPNNGNIKELVNAAKNLSKGAYPPVLKFRTEEYAHAVNVIGIFPDDANTNFYIITIYDCNNPDVPRYIWVSKDYETVYLCDLNENGFVTADEITNIDAVVKSSDRNDIDYWAPGLSSSNLYSSSLRQRSIELKETTGANTSSNVMFLMASDAKVSVKGADGTFFEVENDEICDTNILSLYYEYLPDFGLTKIFVPYTTDSYIISSDEQFYTSIEYNQKMGAVYCDNGGVISYDCSGKIGFDAKETNSMYELGGFKYNLISDSDVLGVAIKAEASESKLDFSNKSPEITSTNLESIEVSLQLDDENFTIKPIEIETNDCSDTVVLKADTDKDIYYDEIHEYNIVSNTAPTCTSQGYTTYTCKCGDSYVADYVDKLEHKDTDGDYKCDYGCGYEFEKLAEPCSCNCHAGGIKAFFFKIINFFQKLFGINKVCACGVKH